MLAFSKQMEKSMESMEIQNMALKLDRAAQNRIAVKQFSIDQKISLDEAYKIQEKLIARREERNQPITGIKMGFTSFAKMEQMGVHDMIWGRLTRDMEILKGETVSLNEYIHPRAEPEICFRVAKTIDKEISIDDAKSHYVDAVCGAIEIIDSRYENFKFSLEDVIADNCSSAGYALGSWHHIDKDIKDLDIKLYFDEEVVASGSSNDILGNPWLSVVHASRLCSHYGFIITEGSILLAGAATNAIFLKSGTKVRAEIQGFDDIGFQVV
ncbi:MAG TPA: fumarylacetoacetate hydrolase family protein [Saprospiraceae bacterium]|nr:fumarylacetoacetate hydrolase family protein [Saprospiraceae bacterium]